MKTISKLSYRSLKSNKSKSILTATAIALTTFLLTSVGIVCSNFIEINRQSTIERAGSYHGIYRNVSNNDLNIMENNIDIEIFGVLKGVAVSEYKDSSLLMAYLDDNASRLTNTKIINGKMPVKKNEIAVQGEYLKRLGLGEKVGQKVLIKYDLNDDVKENEFIISGIIKTKEVNNLNQSYEAIVSKEFLTESVDPKDMMFNAYVKVNSQERSSGDNIKNTLKKVAQDIGIKEKNIKINEDYISAISPDSSVIIIGVVVAGIIVVSSILVIYSIFYISLIGKVQEYGKLRALGATKKQIKRIILREGMMLSAVSIPTGLIIGYLIANFIISKQFLYGNYILSKSHLPIISLAITVSLITVVISLIKPMKVASKASPVEAIRYNGGINSSKKVRKGYKNINIKRLTFANLKRNKKRTIMTLASLSLSGILFITMSVLAGSMNPIKIAEDRINGDFELSLIYDVNNKDKPNTNLNVIQIDNPLSKELKEELHKTQGVNKVKTIKSLASEFEVESGDYVGETEKIAINSFNREDITKMKKTLVKGELEYNNLLKGGEIICTNENVTKWYGIDVGDKVKFKIFDGNKSFEKEFIVKGIVNTGGSLFKIPEEVIDGISENNLISQIAVDVYENYKEAVKEELSEIVENNKKVMLIRSLDEDIKTYSIMIKSTKLVAYSLIITIGTIGVINLINTMIASVITRRREIGILQAIGLSNKQLLKMLQMEGMFYTICTVLITLTLGNGLGYLAYLAAKNSGLSYLAYSYPLLQTIIMIGTIVFIQLLLTWLITKTFNKQSLIDRVRYEE